MATPSMLRRFDAGRPQHTQGGAPPKAPFPMVAFKMLKKGARGKLEAKDLFVPEATNFAAQVQKNVAAQQKEARELKASTLLQASRQD